MLDPILITPDNRLLGFSTHDLSLYGGQTSPEFRIGPADPALPAAENPGPAAAPAALAGPAALPSDPQRLEPDLARGEAAMPDAPALSPFTAASVAAAQAPVLAFAPDVTAPLVPAAASSGASPTLPPAQLVQPASEAVPQTPSLLPESVAAGLVTTVLPEMPSPFATDIADTVQAPVAEIAQTVAAVAAPLQAETAGLHEAIVQPVEAAVAPLDAATSGPLADIGTTVLDDDLAGLTGSDPAGGVTTLVSLVSIGDVFDVGDGGTQEGAAQAPVPDLLDTLAADLPAESPLLGDTHDDDSPLGDLPDPDPLGLF